MGSFAGTCEIVESNEELDSFRHSRGTNRPCSGLGMDENVGKLPMLKTGRHCSVDNDINQIFEAIDRRTSSRGLGLQHQSGTGMPSKNASKKPIRVGISQTSGIGVPESVSLKQALRGLRISHASEMAAMKRLSKPIGSPGISESGALDRLYKAVVVESSEGGHRLDEGEGSLVEFSLVPEKSASNSFDEISESVQLPKSNSTSVSAHSSPRLAIATNRKMVATNTELQDEIVPASREVGGKPPMHKLAKKANPKCAPLSSTNTTKKASDIDEIILASTEVRSKASMLELVHKGQLYSPHSRSSSKTASKVSKSASNSPWLVKPFVANAATAKRSPTRERSQHENILISTSVDMGTTSKVSKSASNSPRMVKQYVRDALTAKPSPTRAQSQYQNILLSNSVDMGTISKLSKSASNSPRMVKPLSVMRDRTAKPAATRAPPQDEIVLEPTSVDKGTASKMSKCTSNSPKMVKPISATHVTRAKPTMTEILPQDDIVSESAEVGSKVAILKPIQKGNLKSAPSLSSSNTIKKVLEVEDFDPSPRKIGSKLSALKLTVKDELHSATSPSCSTASQVSKSASNSPRLVKPIFRHRSFVKKKVKEELTSSSSSSAVGNGVDSDDVLSTKNNLVCRVQSFNQKTVRKGSASPASSSTSVSAEVSSRHIVPGSVKGNERAVGVKSGEKSRLGEKGDLSQSSKSSIGDYSSSTSISEESNLSGSSFSGNRPHMSKDLRWDAIHHVEMRYGSLGLRNFKLLKRLGCGDIGTVYLAELSGTNCLFALKVMDNEYLASRKKMPRAQTEREILQMLDHPFLPTLYSHFTTDKFSCLVMEFCPGGDLHVLRQRQPNRSFSEQAARFYVAEVLLALEYLHMLGVVYRDLKPENILVREDGHIMLSDFDLSLRCTVNPTLLKSSLSAVEPVKKLSGPCAESSCIDPFCLQPSWPQVSCFSPRLISASARTRKLKADQATQVSPLPQLVAEPTSARSNSFVGTHEYLAPEIIKGEGHGSAVDWWTFGIFLYELLFGKTPFKGSGNEDTLANVVLHSLKFPESPSVSFEARDLIRGLLVKEPGNRLGSVKGATEIKQHSFFDGLNWALIRCAIPPEVPTFYDSGDTAVACQQKEMQCREFRNPGEHLEFELF